MCLSSSVLSLRYIVYDCATLLSARELIYQESSSTLDLLLTLHFSLTGLDVPTEDPDRVRKALSFHWLRAQRYRCGGRRVHSLLDSRVGSPSRGAQLSLAHLHLRRRTIDHRESRLFERVQKIFFLFFRSAIRRIILTDTHSSVLAFAGSICQVAD